VIGLGLVLGLVLASLAPGPAAVGADTSGSRTPGVPTIYHKSRSFRIPFNVDPTDRPRLKEVQLWVSEDTGYTWKTVSRTTPDRPAFTFRAARDAEYWFAVRTVDNKGQLYPGEDEKVDPSMKVVVDTTPPRLALEPDGRRGSLAAVRWEVKDEHLDLKSLVLEYQVEGARDWRQLRISRPGLLGEESWDAGTAEPLKVRASVGDKAGNVAEVVITLSEGSAPMPGVASSEPAEFPGSSPVSQISSGPTFPTRDESPRGPLPGPAQARDSFPWPSQDRHPTPLVPPAAGSTGPELPPFGNESDHFGGSGAGPTPSGGSFAQPAAPEAPSAGGGMSNLLVSNPRFPLQYAVEDAGPSGPATVELWVTQDGGRTWFPKGEDPDRASPFPVDLGGEGTFGLRLVARAASGLGDQPPGPGDPPDMRVEIDSTPPTVQMLPPQVGNGPNLGKVAVHWRASDLHLGPKPILISWRPDQPGAQWQPITPEPVANTGTFTWSVPANGPARFHLRVDALDAAGNRGFSETSDGPPVIVDRTRPRSRIIGLDPSARAGIGPGGRSLR
jgi:hypothetical protein